MKVGKMPVSREDSFIRAVGGSDVSTETSTGPRNPTLDLRLRKS